MKGEKELICRLKKYLYGLKQSPRMWGHKFDSHIQELGFKRSQDNHFVYSKIFRVHFIYVALSSDDMLLV